MRREEFLEHIGEQAEIDPRKDAQGRAVFATPTGASAEARCATCVLSANPGDNRTSEGIGPAEGEQMVSNGKKLLGEHYERDHLTYEEMEDLEVAAVTENGETISPEELRGKIFRIVDRDEASGYVVRNMETPEEGTTLCYLQASSS